MNIRPGLTANLAAHPISRTVVVLFIVLTIYPMLFVLNTSFKSTAEFFVNVWGLPKNVHAINYPKAWLDAHIGEYFLNSSIVVGISVLFIVIFGAMAGYALARLHVPFASGIMFLILSTTMLPSESAIMPLYIMMSRLHMIGELHSLIIPYIGWGLPMTVFIFRSFFRTLPEELLEAARVDGCNETKTFYRITVPLMLPAIATCAIFNFVSFWGELLWGSIALSTSPLKTIPMGVIAFKSQFATDWGPLSAAICLVLIPLVAMFLFVQKYFVQGLTGGAVKG